MLSISCVFTVVNQVVTCVKNLTLNTVWLYFLFLGVDIKNYLTQFIVSLCTYETAVFTSCFVDLYPLTTAPTTNTI
jgi:hypothetical protein